MQDQRLEWLRTKMDSLFEFKAKLEAQGKNFNSYLQGGREFRNPRICERIIEGFNLHQYGTNLSPYGPDQNNFARKP